MKLYLAKCFDDYDWYPNYRILKKKLRKDKTPFIIKKLSTDNGILHSIWSTEEHIEKVRAIVSAHYANDPWLAKQAEQAEIIAQEFEETWLKSILYWVTIYTIRKPFHFFIIVIMVLSITLFPFLRY